MKNKLFFSNYYITTCLITLAFVFSLKASESNSFNIKHFLSSRPTNILDFAATFEVTNGSIKQMRYCYIRYQYPDFVALQSLENPSVLLGMIGENENIPSGVGRYGSNYWSFQGNRYKVGVFEWSGEKTNAPIDVVARIDNYQVSPINELLTLGCHLALVGSFIWEDNWAHLSLKDSEIDAELIIGHDKKVQGMRYGLRPAGATERKSMPENYWLFEYKYGGSDVPEGFPSCIERNILIKGQRRLVDRIKIHRLTLATNTIPSKMFKPGNFLNPGAQATPGAFLGDKKALLLDGKWQLESGPSVQSNR